MKRVLRLDGSNDKERRLFEMLYRSMQVAQPQQGRSAETIRTEAAILEKLDAIGSNGDGPAPLMGAPAGIESRTLTAEAVCLELTQPELELLTNYVTSAGWMPRLSRDVVELLDTLAASERI